MGPEHGEAGRGGECFNDATDGALNLNDTLVSIDAGWSSDTLDYLKLTYSNGKAHKRGDKDLRNIPTTISFKLNRNESINGVRVYAGVRNITNLYKSNGTLIVVGVQFLTDQRQSDLFGSSNGTKSEELMPGSSLAYVRGKAYGYIDAIRFVWYQRSREGHTAGLSPC